MNRNRLARVTAVAAATLTGLGLFFLCLGSVQAQETTARAVVPAASQIWHVDNSPGEGLVGYWKFDELSGTHTLNSALLTNTTTLENGASLTTAIPTTVSVPNFSSLLLDGVNDDALVNDASALNVSPSSFSVAAWVRRVVTGTHTADLIYDSGTQTSHWFFGFLSNDKLAFTTNGVVDYSSTFTVTDANWHHVAAVVNGSGAGNLLIYLDGAPAPAITAVITSTPSGSKRIGNKTVSQNTPFSGNIDELRLYNRPLSAAEVGRLAAGRGCAADGATWPTAFEDLQCALEVAQNGDQVWVAAGTYRPGAAKFASYGLVNGVSLFGGFSGTESSPAQRPLFDPHAPLTKLSGDVAGNDQTATFANFGENTCNVLKAGSLAFPGSVSATLDGLAIQDGNADAGVGCGNFPSAASGGGLLALGPSQLVLNNVVFQFNRSSGPGGGLLNSFGQLSLSSALFFSNTADIGGGLASEGGSVTVTASSFVSNTAGRGGGLAVEPAGGHTTLAVSQTSFSHNQAQDAGAAESQVLTGALDLSFDHDSFTNNQATGGDGGAVSDIAVDPAVVRTNFSQSTFTSNVADQDGGAISDFGGQLTIDGSQFTSNSSSSSVGGALEAQSVVTVTNSAFMSNTAHGGGAVHVNGTLVMSGSSVILNQAQDPGLASDFAPVGGGVFVSGTALITNTQFFSNSAFLQGAFSNLAEGGGLAATGDLVLSGGDFRDNSAEHGGGLRVQGSASIQHSLFQGNHAGSGGGVFAEGSLVLLFNRLIDNTALESLANEGSFGGGLALQNGLPNGLVINNLFLGNRALASDATTPHGSALSLDGQTTTVADNTIVARGLDGASAASQITGSVAFFNNLITSHTVALEQLGGATLFEDYNLFHANTTNISAIGVISSGGHSRTADPRFAAPGLDDFRLRLDSPAVDAGDNNRVLLHITIDLAGGPRFVDVPSVPDTGAGVRPIVDIGAYEVNNRLLLPLVMR